MGNLRDVISQYQTYHPSSCPCGKAAKDFMKSYEPIDFHQEKAEEILLVSTIPSSHVNYLQIVRKHVLILAQK